jgi:filamentous hemagglutinin family protein
MSKPQHISSLHRFTTVALLSTFAMRAWGNPTGFTVGAGSASVAQAGSQLHITAGNNAVINWKTFNIGAGETTTFLQPSSTSIVWNRINDQNPSQIYGSLQANGVVVLLNSSGFYFGPNSFVSAAGLVVSTANYVPPQNGGGSWVFNGPPPLASIVNYGQIKIGNGGDCFFIADQINNHGTVEAPGGNVGFAAGQTVTLSERPDGRGMSMAVTLPQGSVDNHGNVIADGGTIALNAKVVNQDGLLQANSVVNRNGVIELVAADALSLGADSRILARGNDATAGSAGGTVTLKSADTFTDAAGSRIVTSGGMRGGNGGNIEVSAPRIESLNSAMDASAQAGYTGGEFLLDPDYIVLANSGNGAVDGTGGVAYDSGSGVLTLNVNSAFANKNFLKLNLQAASDITVNGNVIWNLSQSTGVNAGQLVLQAGGDIYLKNGAKIIDGNNWSVSLQAGYDFVNQAVSYGTGSIYMNSGSGSIQTAAGNIHLQAGQDILIGSGYVRTSGGGSATAEALAGSIDTGTYAHGYLFNSASSLNSTYYKVDPINGTGGISTMNGGDVTLIAGGDISSYLPSGNNATTIGGDAGSGAFGPNAGNVTVVAGGNVTGHYVVANGTGKIVAGALMNNGVPVLTAGGSYQTDPNSLGSAGTGDTKLALSLISGGWTVAAAYDINLQEVRNPNGVFNRYTSAAVLPSYHYFNYSADAYVNLDAGHGATLGDSSSSLPRDNADGLAVPFIYAPILNILAGSGGVMLTGDGDPYNRLILFPSKLGSLTIQTTDKGALMGSLPANADGTTGIFDLIVSDSAQTQYYDANLDLFGLNDHASTPIHWDNPTPVTLDISGNMDSVLLGSPEAAQIKVGGNLVNSRFQGMNLSADASASQQVQVRQIDGRLGTATVHPGLTSIDVTGDIQNRSEFTSIANVATAPNLDYLNQVYPPSSLAANLAKQLYYDSNTKTLTFQGELTASVLALLQSATVQVYQDGLPVFDPNTGDPVLTTVSILDATTLAQLQTQYAALGALPTTRDSGYIIGGGGKFTMTAKNIDLGTTLGIKSMGVGYDTISTADADGNTTVAYPLSAHLTTGADIQVYARENLSLFSTVIASLNDSKVNVVVGGTLNVGSSAFSGTSVAPRGIYSAGLGDVVVTARGDINVNGGGNVTVESLTGNVNAGSGESGFVVAEAFKADPLGNVTSTSSTIPGSGILATSFTQPGNILVEAPNGGVNAGAGGIIQLLLNHPVGSEVTLFDLPVDRDHLAELVRLSFSKQTKKVQALEHVMNGVAGDSQVAVYAGDQLQPKSGPVLDDLGNPVITAANLSDGVLVQTSDGRNIDSNGSGVIGAGTVTMKATGNISGNVFALDNVNIDAAQNISVSVLGLGTVSVNSAAGNVVGTIVGIGGVSASGLSIEANLESNSSISGNTSGEKGLAAGTAADSTASAASAGNNTEQTTHSGDDNSDDLKKKKKGIVLAQKVSRVTVLLPVKN